MPCGLLSAVAMVAAVGCSNPDVCHQALNYVITTEQQEVACLASLDAGANPALALYASAGAFDAGAFLAQCESELPTCSPQAIATEQHIISCLQSAGSFQCKWFTELANGTIDSDPSYTAWGEANLACYAEVADGGGGSCGTSTVSSGTTGSTGTATWAGSYSAMGGYFGDSNEPSVPSPSGGEVLTESGTQVTWTNFAAPTFTACTLTVTPSGSEVDLSTQHCGAYTFSSGSTATLYGGSAPEIEVDINGTDVDGGDFYLNFSLQ